ncbi:MAG: GNAT family N-acetyltransferase [Planctomycetes bacterium]|nr:GNAT family N-acetyltransferase [Planctomycetota bacterium]
MRRRLRDGRSEDWEQLVALEEACFPASDRFPARTWKRLLGSALVARTACTIVVEDHGRIVAAICGLFRARARVARIYSLAVGPDQRGRGLAQELVRGFARRARARGCRTLSLEVRERNEAARALYGRLDFTVVERLPGYYGRSDHGLRYRIDLGRSGLGSRP